jgi:hypothetical protein
MAELAVATGSVSEFTFADSLQSNSRAVSRSSGAKRVAGHVLSSALNDSVAQDERRASERLFPASFDTLHEFKKTPEKTEMAMEQDLIIQSSPKCRPIQSRCEV